MASTNPSSTNISRIGMSLVKYLKPIRVTAPHHVPFERSTKVTPTKVKPPKIVPIEEHERNQKEEAEKRASFQRVHFTAVEETKGVEEARHALEKTPSSWVDLIIHLIGACRKLSERLRQTRGKAAYRKALDDEISKKVRTLGAIVDQNSDEELSDREKKPA